MGSYNKDGLLFYSDGTRCIVPFMAASNDAAASLICMLLEKVISWKTMKLHYC